MEHPKTISRYDTSTWSIQHGTYIWCLQLANVEAAENHYYICVLVTVKLIMLLYSYVCMRLILPDGM